MPHQRAVDIHAVAIGGGHLEVGAVPGDAAMNRRHVLVIDANIVRGVPANADRLQAGNAQGLDGLFPIMNLEIQHRRVFVHSQ